MKAHVEVYRDTTAKQEWRSRVVASNKKIIAASSEGYRHKGHALRMAKKYYNAKLPVTVLD